MNKINKIVATISSIALIVGILISLIFGFAMNRSFYEYEYTKGNQASLIGMSDEDLMRSTNALLDYIQGERDDIVEVVTVYDYEREVFNERETLHMVDVKHLYDQSNTARWLLLAIAVAGILFVWMREKKECVNTLWNGYIQGLTLILIFVGFIAVWAIADFDQFWLQFHYVFFDNDLFLLDPNTSIMINMFPGTFFSDMVIGIILLFASVIGILALILRKLSKKLC